MKHNISNRVAKLPGRSGEPVESRPTPTPHPTYKHIRRKQIKGKQHSRMQGKWSNLQNFPCQECKQNEKSSHTSKIRKQKTR